jgi:cellulose synthase/poly-beta-1,6-N-acetylglucosamine synthase-like glycosyltransferase
VTTLAVVCALLLFLVWVAYPLFMRLVGSLAGPLRAREPAVWPAVTAVVASRDPASDIGARIDDLLATDYPGPLDVVVALDAASSTEERDLAGRSRVAVVRGDAPGGKALALNAAVRAATGEVLVFTDTHQRFAPDAIRALVAALSAGRYGAASGQLELPERGRASLIERYWRMERRLRRDEALVHSAIGVSGSIYAMRRDLWAPLPAGLILDDLYVPMRLVLAGRRVGFTAAARAFETRETDPAGEYRRKVRTLTGNFQLCAWLPGVLVPVRNPVWPQFLLHKLLRLLTPYLLVGLGAGILGILLQRYGASALVAVAALFVLAPLGALATGKWHGLGRLLAWGISTQGAILVATWNGLRGRWDVWRR